MAVEDDYELINGIPVHKRYIKQPEIVDLPPDASWQEQHELPAAPLPVTQTPAVAPVASQPVAAPSPVQTPGTPQLAPIPEAVAQPLSPANLPTVQDLQRMPQAAPAPVVDPEAAKAEVRATETPTEIGPEAPPEVERDPLVESAVRTGEAIATAESQALAANEAYSKRAEQLLAEREAQIAKQQQRLAQAADGIESASKLYQEQLAKTPPDRKTANLLTILFSTMATAMSRGKIPNNAMQLIQAGAEQQERENLRSNAQAKAEVDRARQLYGDLSAEFDAEEHVFTTRMASHEKNLADRLRTYAQGAKSVQAKEQALTMADSLEAQAAVRQAEATAKAAEAQAKRDAEEEKQRIEQEKLKLSKQQFALDRTKTYADIADKRDNRKLGWARLSLDERKMLKDDEREVLETEYKKAETARLHESVKQMVEGKTIKLVNGGKYSAPTAQIAEKLANIEAFSSHAITGLDELLNIRTEEGKQFWDSPEGKKMTTLYTDLLLQLKGPEYAQLGVIAGPDLELMRGLAGKNPADAWLSTKPQLEGLRKRIAQRRSTQHKILGQYEGEIPEIERRLPASAAQLTPEQAESQFRTAVTAAGTVAPSEDRKSAADSYDSQMKAAGRLPDAYRKFAIARDEEEAAIARLKEKVAELPTGDPQAAALKDQIDQRKEVAQHLGLKQRDHERRFRENGGLKQLNAIQGETRKTVQNRKAGRKEAASILDDYLVKESDPAYAEIQQLRAEGRDLDAAEVLLKSMSGTKAAGGLSDRILKARQLFKE